MDPMLCINPCGRARFPITARETRMLAASKHTEHVSHITTKTGHFTAGKDTNKRNGD